MAHDVESSEKMVSFSRLSLTDRVMFRYIPICGCISYGGFALYIAVPSLYKRYCGDYDIVVSNSLWFNAHIGMALYLYSSKHIQAASVIQRILFTAFNVVMFNFGSVLIWSTTKSVFQNTQIPHLNTSLILGSAIGLLLVGKKYTDFIDSVI